MKTSVDANLLRVDGLTKRFGQKLALDRLTFDIGSGEVMGLLGPNGAGKTTAFLCLCGQLRPDAGTLMFGGRRLDGARGRTISLIPETPDVYPMLTVWEHLAFVAASVRLDAGWERRADELLERFGLSAERHTVGQSLSKGMRQKTLIAATVLAAAPILLFDEPTVGLDPLGQRELRTLIGALAANGTTILVSTHLIESAATLCDRIIILKAGATVAQGAVRELLGSPDAPRSLEDLFFEITT